MKATKSLGGLSVQRLDLRLVALAGGQAGVRAGGRPTRPDQHCRTLKSLPTRPWPDGEQPKEEFKSLIKCGLAMWGSRQPD